MQNNLQWVVSALRSDSTITFMYKKKENGSFIDTN